MRIDAIIELIGIQIAVLCHTIYLIENQSFDLVGIGDRFTSMEFVISSFLHHY